MLDGITMRATLNSWAAGASGLSVGIFGVMSYAATRRRRGIGIRPALGARPREILQLITGEGMVLALCGTAAGVAGALALTRLMSRLLYGVPPVDPLTFITLPLLLTGVALAACAIPAAIHCSSNYLAAAADFARRGAYSPDRFRRSKKIRECATKPSGT